MAGSPLSGRIANRLERLRQHRWRMAPYRSAQRHIVLGGAPRSGTTLLRRLLDRHPEICSGAETKLFVPAGFNLAWLAQAYSIPLAELEAMRRDSTSQAAFIDVFASRVVAAADKHRWAEKTPQNIRHLRWISEHFPGASLVHIIRDGRDVICSMRQHPDWRWVEGGWQKVLVPRPLTWYAQRWLDDTAAGTAWRGDARYVEVRYEDLAIEPVATLRGLCEAIGVATDESWLSLATGRPGAAAGDHPGHEVAHPGREVAHPDYEGAVSDASVGRWRAELDPGEQQEVERLCGPRLRELGYGT
jgi:protein-tyrosine sulfotransferase